MTRSLREKVSTSAIEGHTITVVCASVDETVPSGAALSRLDDLVSLRRDDVVDWIAGHNRGAVYVLPGAHTASGGAPTLVLDVSPPEYERVLHAL